VSNTFLDRLNDDEEEAEIDEIFDGMKERRDNPGLKNICEDDQLIREFTMTLLDKIGSQEEQRKKDKDNIRTKVRTVARIVKKLKENKVNSLKLSEFIAGPQFYNVVRAVKNKCGLYIRATLVCC